MEDNTDNNQSGLPVKGEEEKIDPQDNDSFDHNANSQASGPLETNDPTDDMQFAYPNNFQIPRMVS